MFTIFSFFFNMMRGLFVFAFPCADWMFFGVCLIVLTTWRRVWCVAIAHIWSLSVSLSLSCFASVIFASLTLVKGPGLTGPMSQFQSRPGSGSRSGSLIRCGSGSGTGSRTWSWTESGSGSRSKTWAMFVCLLPSFEELGSNTVPQGIIFTLWKSVFPLSEKKNDHLCWPPLLNDKSRL